MTVKVIRALVAGTTLLASGSYTFVYLYRWEWNRALISAAIFIAAEIALVGWLLADRLGSLSRRLDVVAAEPRGPRSAQQRQQLTERIHEAAPPSRVRFDWLARPGQMNVFVPVLMGAGVLLSGLAWVVERLARATVGPVAERGLAGQLEGLALPAEGFAATGSRPSDLLRGPGGRHRPEIGRPA